MCVGKCCCVSGMIQGVASCKSVSWGRSHCVPGALSMWRASDLTRDTESIRRVTDLVTVKSAGDLGNMSACLVGPVISAELYIESRTRAILLCIIYKF